MPERSADRPGGRAQGRGPRLEQAVRAGCRRQSDSTVAPRPAQRCSISPGRGGRARGRGRRKTPTIIKIPPSGTNNRRGNRIAMAASTTAATDRGLRLAQAAGRPRVGRANQRAAVTVPTRPQAPRHITTDPLFDTPGKIQSSTQTDKSVTAITPTSNRRAAAFESSIRRL